MSPTREAGWLHVEGAQLSTVGRKKAQSIRRRLRVQRVWPESYVEGEGKEGALAKAMMDGGSKAEEGTGQDSQGKVPSKESRRKGNTYFHHEYFKCKVCFQKECPQATVHIY